jgi:glycine cleavage system aminomethyltransferase T
VKCHIARGGYTGEDGFEVSDVSDVGGARAVGLMP